VIHDDFETVGDKLDQANDELARLRSENEALRRAIADGKFLADDLMAEYKALWSAAVAFMNAPGTVTETDEEFYSDLVNCVFRSRFWIGSRDIDDIIDVAWIAQRKQVQAREEEP
jgi:hypothetical protein